MSGENLPLIVPPGELGNADGVGAARFRTGGQTSELRRVIAPDAGTYLVKWYNEETVRDVRVPRLLDMVHWRRELSAADRQELDRRCAWPLAAVGGGDRVEGIVMLQAPAAMFERRTSSSGEVTEMPRHLDELMRGRLSAERIARNFQLKKAYYEPPYKLAVLGELLDTVNWLHDHGYAVGDLQPRNAVFTLEPRPWVMLLDCDSCVPLGREGALPQVDPEHFKLPRDQRGVPFDRRSDYYKFALSVVRCVQESAQTWEPDRKVLSRVMRTDLVETLIECSRALPPPGTQSRLRGAASSWPRLVIGERIFVSTDDSLKKLWPADTSALEASGAADTAASGGVTSGGVTSGGVKEKGTPGEEITSAGSPVPATTSPVKAVLIVLLVITIVIVLLVLGGLG